jgi:hypothetical protein
VLLVLLVLALSLRLPLALLLRIALLVLVLLVVCWAPAAATPAGCGRRRRSCVWAAAMEAVGLCVDNHVHPTAWRCGNCTVVRVLLALLVLALLLRPALSLRFRQPLLALLQLLLPFLACCCCWRCGGGASAPAPAVLLGLLPASSRRWLSRLPLLPLC